MIKRRFPKQSAVDKKTKSLLNKTAGIWLYLIKTTG
jgi:hypothetical protein